MNDSEPSGLVMISCLAIPGMLPPMLAEPADIRPVLERVADIALAEGNSVALTGWLPPAVGVLCRGMCRHCHQGSIVAMPDVVLLELAANEALQLPDTEVVARPDGRCCHLFAVDRKPSP